MDMKSAYQTQLNQLIDLKNVFMIKPNTKDGKDLKIAIDYSPMYSEALGCMLNTIPVFNNDGEPSQHGFVLQIDQPIHLGNSIHYRTQYEKKIVEASEKNRNLFVPKPRGTKTFCNVCKEYIEDYLKHTESKTHIQKFRKNKVIKLISSLADEFQKSQSMPQNTLNLHSDADRCGYYQSTFEESLDHYDSTQQEPHTIKKVKLNEVSDKMGNYSNLSLKDNYGRQCL